MEHVLGQAGPGPMPRQFCASKVASRFPHSSAAEVCSAKYGGSDPSRFCLAAGASISDVLGGLVRVPLRVPNLSGALVCPISGVWILHPRAARILHPLVARILHPPVARILHPRVARILHPCRPWGLGLLLVGCCWEVARRWLACGCWLSGLLVAGWLLRRWPCSRHVVGCWCL
jgi:hypothetical protein